MFTAEKRVTDRAAAPHVGGRGGTPTADFISGNRHWDLDLRRKANGAQGTPTPSRDQWGLLPRTGRFPSQPCSHLQGSPDLYLVEPEGSRHPRRILSETSGQASANSARVTGSRGTGKPWTPGNAVPPRGSSGLRDWFHGLGAGPDSEPTWWRQKRFRGCNDCRFPG